jgi:hypothetical protein
MPVKPSSGRWPCAWAGIASQRADAAERERGRGQAAAQESPPGKAGGNENFTSV